MDKRRFRTLTESERATPARYPTLGEFDEGRRSVLRRLGAAVLGLGSLGALLGSAAGCGDRALHSEPDLGPGPAGAAPLPDSRVDREPGGADGGIAPAPDARGDTRPHPDPDAEPDWPMGGVPRMPDAEVDTPKDAGPDTD